MKANRADVQGLAEQISKYLTILQGCANYEAEFTKDFGPLVVQLSQLVVYVQTPSLLLDGLMRRGDNRDLVHIHGVLEAMAHRKLVKRVFHVTTDKKRITECKERLANHFQAFQVGNIWCSTPRVLINGVALNWFTACGSLYSGPSSRRDGSLHRDCTGMFLNITVSISASDAPRVSWPRRKCKSSLWTLS